MLFAISLTFIGLSVFSCIYLLALLIMRLYGLDCSEYLLVARVVNNLKTKSAPSAALMAFAALCLNENKSLIMGVAVGKLNRLPYFAVVCS